MGAAINAERERRGLRPLAWSENLAAAARRHAADMAAHPGLVHTGSDGSEAWVHVGMNIAEQYLVNIVEKGAMKQDVVADAAALGAAAVGQEETRVRVAEQALHRAALV